MDLGPHAIFIVASYAATAIILAFLIGWIMIESRTLRRTIAELDARGITRRSDDRKATAQKPAAHASAA
ncbi:heme exporter protein CcmD [Pseudorhodoplanes sp.]|uniref:heme exporter protein CcmD n=1 Tax=Pseudorhodoplanes sp. TaxID=1934341 RepID=UPI0039191062